MLGANAFGWAYLGQAYGASGTPPSFPIRLSQDAIESLTGLGNKVRLSQAAVEVTIFGYGRVRLSQAAIEALKQRPVGTFVGLSQAVIEALEQQNIVSRTRMSQLSIEVLVPPAPFPGQGRFWAQIV